MRCPRCESISDGRNPNNHWTNRAAPCLGLPSFAQWYAMITAVIKGNGAVYMRACIPCIIFRVALAYCSLPFKRGATFSIPATVISAADGRTPASYK